MDNNKEGMENQIANEETAKDEVVLEVKEKRESKFLKWVKVILSGVIDQIAAVVIGLILFLAVTFALKVAGYKIVEREEMFLIVFIISNVLYYPLVQEFLGGKTLGKKLVQR